MLFGWNWLNGLKEDEEFEAWTTQWQHIPDKLWPEWLTGTLSWAKKCILTSIKEIEIIEILSFEI